MREFKRLLRQEQKRLDTLLALECAALPATVRPVAEHIFKAGGKRLRPILTVFTARLFNFEHPDIDTMAVAAELVHMASLLHDDIYDHAKTRRGKASAHTIFGAVPSMLAGDAMLGHAAGLVSTIRMPELLSCFANAVVNTASGEVLEFNHLGEIDLDAEIYLEIIRGKTAWAMRAACEGAALRAGADAMQLEAAATFGMELGTAFQIVDDALDMAPERITGKPAGGDLREGKCTPPIQLYWKSLPLRDAAEFARKFKAKSLSEAEIDAVVQAVRSAGLDKKTRGMALEHLEKAEAALTLLPEGPHRTQLLKVAEYVRTREY